MSHYVERSMRPFSDILRVLDEAVSQQKKSGHEMDVILVQIYGDRTVSYRERFILSYEKESGEIDVYSFGWANGLSGDLRSWSSNSYSGSDSYRLKQKCMPSGFTREVNDWSDLEELSWAGGWREFIGLNEMAPVILRFQKLAARDADLRKRVHTVRSYLRIALLQSVGNSESWKANQYEQERRASFPLRFVLGSRVFTVSGLEIREGEPAPSFRVDPDSRLREKESGLGVGFDGKRWHSRNLEMQRHIRIREKKRNG